MNRLFYFITITFILSPFFLFSQKKITLEDIWQKYLFVPDFYDDISFLNDNIHYVKSDNKKIISYNALTGDSEKTIFDIQNIPILKNKNIHSFTLNSNNDKILIATNATSKYRNTFKAQYYIYDLKKNIVDSLAQGSSDVELPNFNDDNNSVSYIKDNNIYIYKQKKDIPITHDGVKNAIINGRSDWAYEEEFETVKTYEWSPNGNLLAWIKFDETKVNEYPIIKFDSLNPNIQTYKYPLPGQKNSQVSVWLFDTLQNKTYQINIPDGFEYIPLIKWSNDGKYLAIQTLNRLQNETNIYAYSPEQKQLYIIYSEKRNSYITFPTYFTWLKSSNHFAIIREKDNYNRLCTYTIDGKLERVITEWNNDVTQIITYDKDADYLFFEFAEPDEMQRRIYKVRPDGSSLGCITPENGTNSNAIFSNNYKHCIYTNSNSKQEWTIYSFDSENNLKSTLYTNKATLLEQDYSFSPKEFFTIQLDSTLKLNAWIIKPPHFRKTKKYPVLLSIYSGPGAQTVTNEFEYNFYWYQYLAQHGYIVLSIDPRGTDARGSSFRNAQYKQLGFTQMLDLTKSIEIIKKQRFIDSTRIGIEGWSFGGYQTLMCMTHSKLFKCGIAIAPVTDWNLYDCIYTERYMQTPLLNPDGYKKTSILNAAANLHGKLFLIHGTSDDNVHIDNTYRLCKVLNENQKQYDLKIFPEKRHSISGKGTRYYLYREISDFLFKNL